MMSCRYCDGLGVTGYTPYSTGRPCLECGGSGLSPLGQAVRRVQDADARRVLQVVELGPISGDGLARGYASGIFARPVADIWHPAPREPLTYMRPRIERTATGFAIYRDQAPAS